MKKRITSLCVAAICIILAVLSGATGTWKVQAEEAGKVVRIGYYPIEGYHALINNEGVGGYEAEYIERISWAAGWNVEYVQVDSWTNLVELLRSGQVDMISPVQKTLEREEEFAFSAEPVCMETGAIVTLEATEVEYEEFDKFSEMTFGVESDVVFDNAFSAYTSGFVSEDQIRRYPTNEALVAALHAGEVDAIVENVMRLQDGQKVIGKLEMNPAYFMLQKDNYDLTRELNNATARVLLTDVDLKEELLNKYFPDYNLTPLTKEEKELVKTIGSLKVGCVTDNEPLCYVAEDGEMAGITIELLKLVEEYTGLEFEYVELPQGMLTYEDIIKENVQLLASVEYNTLNAKDGRIQMTDAYLVAEKCFVGKRGTQFSVDMTAKIGITAGSETFSRSVNQTYPNMQMTYYVTLEEALEALQNDEIDFVLQNQYSLNRMLERPIYSDLSVVSKATLGDARSAALLCTDNEGNEFYDSETKDRLMSIINKGVESISRLEQDMVVMQTTIDDHYEYSLFDMIYTNRFLVGVLVVVLAMLFFLLIFSLQVHKKNIKLLKTKEKRLIKEKSKLEVLSNTDALTGLQNKSSFRDSCISYLEANEGRDCAFLFLDLDNFKQINDELGHMQGDFVLEKIADVMRQVCWKDSYLTRFGGDEFCVLITDATKDVTEAKIKEILRRVAAIEIREGESDTLTTSVGCVIFPAGPSEFDTVLDKADQCLYQAKTRGKNQYVIEEMEGTS